MERRNFLRVSALGIAAVSGVGRARNSAASQSVYADDSGSPVFFSKTITPEKALELFQKLNRPLTGKVAVKTHSGEPTGNHYLKPEFLKPLVDNVHGTFVECNTAYEGRRMRTEDHLKVVEEHGFEKVAPFDIMDAEGEIELPIPKGKRIKANYVGANLEKYDSMLVTSHFKGHMMGGFGGALKNISIGIASSYGKAFIHGAGDPERIWTCEQDLFLEAMADACRSILDKFGENIAFVNVMKDLSVDCDCDGHPHAPEMADIGILASLDPVALDQACVDLVYQSDDAGKASLIERMETRNAVHILEAAEELGVGSRKYKLIEID
ncbi:MAG: DUF362 domain-containing protein [Thermoguttaceae bacterium]|nr:DUF362 domain-containing protein [Thermoguttaceae bacterium]